MLNGLKVAGAGRPGMGRAIKGSLKSIQRAWRAPPRGARVSPSCLRENPHTIFPKNPRV